MPTLHLIVLLLGGRPTFAIQLEAEKCRTASGSDRMLWSIMNKAFGRIQH